jgi:uncharacterized membrane protein
MDDFLGQAVPSPILDNEASGSKAGTATIGLACLNWIKAAAARSRGAPVKRYGPLAALTACLFGLACLGLPSIQRPGQTLSSAEINSPAQKTTKESHAQRVEAEAIRAAQSLNTEEVSAPETAKLGLEAAKDETGPGNVEAAGETSRLPPKPVGEACQRGANDRFGSKRAVHECQSQAVRIPRSRNYVPSQVALNPTAISLALRVPQFCLD